MKTLLKGIMFIICVLSISGSLCFAKGGPHWTPISGNENNMIVFGKISIEGIDFNSGGYVLYSFGPGGEKDCRSKSEIEPDGTYYATIRSNNSEEAIHFKVHNSKKGNIHHLKNTITFEKDITKKSFNMHLDKENF